MTDFDVHPAASRYYPHDIESAMQATRERIEEWEYSEDAHGYCHTRPDWVALLDEIERLRTELAKRRPATATGDNFEVGHRAYWVHEHTYGLIGTPITNWQVYSGVVMSTGPALTQVWNDNGPDPRAHHPLTFANDQIWPNPATPESIVRDKAV